MTEPEYKRELIAALGIAEEAVHNIGYYDVFEQLPLWDIPPEAIDRIMDLLRHTDVTVSAQTEKTYLAKGEIR